MMKTRLELNIGCGVNKTVVALIDENHSEAGTKRALAKKGLELIAEKWNGRSDYMELFNRDYDVMLKKMIKNICECYVENPDITYVEIQPVAKRVKKTVNLNIRTREGLKEVVASPYKTKVAGFENLRLYVYKNECSNWVVTEASTGLMLVSSYSTKKVLEENLEANKEKLLSVIPEKIKEMHIDFGNANPHLVPEDEIYVESIEEKVAKKIERRERIAKRRAEKKAQEESVKEVSTSAPEVEISEKERLEMSLMIAESEIKKTIGNIQDLKSSFGVNMDFNKAITHNIKLEKEKLNNLYDEKYSIEEKLKLMEEEEMKTYARTKDILIEAEELIESEFQDMENLTEAIMDVIGDKMDEFVKMNEADKFDFLIDGILELKNNDTIFNPENTAIDTKNSKSAEVVAKVATSESKILDYGCGTGRNIRYILENSSATVDGTDIPVQLEKEMDKHNELRSKGCIIAEAEKIKNNSYDMVLNSHVLNVIASDEVKQIVVADIFKKLKDGGKAVIEVRTKQDVEKSKTKEKFGDGWKIKKGSSFTYQEGISKEKMIKLVTSVGFKIEKHIFNSSNHIVQVVK